MFEIVNFILSYGRDPIAWVVLSIVAGIWVLIYEDKEKLRSWIVHPRNKGDLTVLILFGGFLTVCFLTKCLPPNVWACGCLLWAIYFLACSIHLAPKHFAHYRHAILRYYHRKIKLGQWLNAVKFFSSPTHWFLQDTDAKIEYQLLRYQFFQYRHELETAYEIVNSIPEEWLYKEEKASVSLYKVQTLIHLGNISMAEKFLEKEGLSNSQEPAIWCAYAQIAENKGDLATALKYAQKARDLANLHQKTSAHCKAAVYNEYGRYCLLCGNQQEALQYYYQALNIAKTTPHIALVPALAHNLILRLAMQGEQAEAEKVLSLYQSLIKEADPSAKIEFYNTKVAYYQQIGKEKEAYELVQKYYKEVMPIMPTAKQEVLKSSVFKLLMEGRFVHDWLDKDISTDMATYSAIDLNNRLHVFCNYMIILTSPHLRAVCNDKKYENLKSLILNYYQTQAISDIDEYLHGKTQLNLMEYYFMMRQKLWILQLLDKEEYVTKNYSLFMSLISTLDEGGLHLLAVKERAALVDACSSPYALLFAPSPEHQPISLHQYFEHVYTPKAPVPAGDGIHLNYELIQYPSVFVYRYRYQEIIDKQIPLVKAEIATWKNHPFRQEISFMLAGILTMLRRFDEARQFYACFESGGVAFTRLTASAQESVRYLHSRLYGK